MKKMPYFFKSIIPLLALFLSLAPVKHLMATPAVQDSIIGLYTAYYNRAPDQGGFDYWNQQAASTSNSTALFAISEGFSQHPQFLQDYPLSDSTTQFVTKIYNNILNRAPDTGGLDFWVNALNEGLLKSEFIVTYVNDVLAYSGTHPEGIKSKQMFSNKVTVGQCFIDALGAESNGEPDSLAYSRSIEVLSGVTEDDSSMGLAVNKIKSYLPANTALPSSCPEEDMVEIVINNPKLQACLNEQLGHPPSQIELHTLQSFTCRDKELVDSDIIELEQLTALTSLDLSSEISHWTHGNESNDKVTPFFASETQNRISDISPLSSLTELRSLYLGGNQISDVAPLATLTQLSNLNLWTNQISDVTPLSTLTQLSSLTLWDNQISDVTPLGTLTQLFRLGLFANQISDVTPLGRLTRLFFLGLNYNQISDLTPLGTLTQLQDLRLSDNQINNVSPLSTLNQLTTLSLNDNQISDVTPLSSLTQLTALDLSYNQINDITPLSSLVTLSTLNPNPNTWPSPGVWLSGNCITNFSSISHINGVQGKESQNSSCQ